MFAMQLASRFAKATFLVAALTTACQYANSQTITAVMHAPLRSVDPTISTAYILRDFGYMIYDTLLAVDANGKIQPQMANWAISKDGKTYTFTLRDDLKWTDGKPVTASDCVASIQRWDKIDTLGQVMASYMSDIKVIDDKSFSMSFSQPTDIVLRALSKPSNLAAFMMPKTVAETPAGQPITSTVGSGPFVFNAVEYKPGIQAVFDKNKNYVPRKEPASGLAGGKVVKVDRVKWTTMPDPMTAMNALMSGEVDFIEQMPPDLLPMIQGNPDYVSTNYKGQAMQDALRLNFTQPPFDNQKVRQAALLAVGQKQVLEAQVGNNQKLYQTCAAVFGCGNAAASNYGADKLIAPHPAEAKALLKEAGYTNAPVVLLSPTDNAKLTPMGPVLAQQLRAAGFNVQLQSMDWATVTTRRTSKAPTSAGGWSAFFSTNVLPDIGDPIGYMEIAANGDKAWFGWPNVPAIEAARKQLAVTSDPTAAKAIAEELQHLAIDNVVMIPVGQIEMVTIKSKKLTGQVDAAAPVFWNMTKAER